MHVGQFGAKTAGTTRTASLYDGSSCPAGQEVVRHVSTPISPAYIGAPTTKQSVYCKPFLVPVAPAPAPVAGPTYTTTISPVLQTEVSPQISPVFQQTQDSPGAVQAATPTMIAPGGMEAEGGSASDPQAMLDFLRVQAEQDARRRTEETALREQERRDALAREETFRQQQLDFQRDQAAIQAEQQAAIAAGDAERAAQMEAEYQRSVSEWEKTSAVPGGFAVTSAAPSLPGAAIAEGAAVASEKPGLPMPLIVAGIAALAVGGYLVANARR